MLTLRPYQKEPVRKAIDYFREENPDPSLMVLPTGAGKSVIAAEVAAACPDPILVVQPTKELLEQNLDKYRTLCGELAPAGVYSTSFGKHQIDHVTFATIGSIKTIGTQFRQLGFRKMLIDEAHLYPRKEQSMLGVFLRDSGIRQVLGMTATPLKLENFSVKHGEKYDKWSELIMLTNLSPSGTFFKRIIHVTQIQELTALGYWSPLRYEVLPFSRDHLEMNSAGSEYSDESVITAYEYNNIRANILAALDYHRERKHVLVFVPSVEEAEALASFIPDSAALSGNTPKKERTEIIRRFRAGEIRTIFNVSVLSCLSIDTEILTLDGWKGYEEITYKDKVAQFDTKTSKIDFQFPLHIIHKEHEGKMVVANNRYMNIRVTDDHDLLYTQKTTNSKYKPLSKIKAKQLVDKKYIYIPINGNAEPLEVKMPETHKYSDERFIACNSYNYRKKGYSYEESIRLAEQQLKIKKQQKAKTPQELTKDDCNFIGFWLGDGSVSLSKKQGKKNGNRYSLSQSTANPAMIDWVENLLLKCKIKYSKHEIKPSNDVILGRKCNVNTAYTYILWKGTGGVNQLVNSDLYKLLPYLKKDGTNLFWGLSRDQFYYLMEGFYKANGNHGNNREYTGKKIISSNKKLLDLLQAIGVCRGYRIIVTKEKLRKHTKNPLYGISLFDIHYHEFVNNKLQSEKNDKENVWCVTMPKGTIITRRNGRVSILGNCGFDYPEIDMLVTGFSTASMAKYYQVLGRGVRIHPDKKDCVIVEAGGNYQRFGKVEDLQYEWDGKWRMFGSGDCLISGIPVQCIGTVAKADLAAAYAGTYAWETLDFGKHKGKTYSEVPPPYLAWMLQNPSPYRNLLENMHMRACAVRAMENHIRDTRNDPPLTDFPDGKYAGENMGFAPRGYLTYYYNSKEWNETNDSLKRGLEILLNKH